jgi:hypothetical protein
VKRIPRCPGSSGGTSFFDGVFSRIAKELNVHPSCVSRVASGDRQSRAVTAALWKEIDRLDKLKQNNTPVEPSANLGTNQGTNTIIESALPFPNAPYVLGNSLGSR